MVDSSFWDGRRVLVTGHTGFKGAWLSLWLHQLGARVSGIALSPNSGPNLFEIAGIAQDLEHHTIGDIRELDTVMASMQMTRPEIVLHLAAQSLVREGYSDPVGTFASNVMGTAHVLEACRQSNSVRAVVVVTSDKCYENREWVHPYRETDALGGNDPYSASKAGAEIVAASYRTSYFMQEGDNKALPKLATARAGNVIGGGDWADDRLVSDCVRSFTAGECVRLRYPNAIRPWLYVLEPLLGYLLLAQKLLEENHGRCGVYDSCFNFAPEPSAEADVQSVAQRLADLWGCGAQVVVDADNSNPREADILRLDASKARAVLGWRPRLTLSDGLEIAVRWYRSWEAGDEMRGVSLSQIEDYQQLYVG